MQTPAFPSCPEVPGKTAWRRDSLRVRLTSARSIEETGLDSPLYGAFFSPHTALLPGEEIRNRASQANLEAGHSMGKNGNRNKNTHKSDMFSEYQHLHGQETNANTVVRPRTHEIKLTESFLENGENSCEKRLRQDHSKDANCKSLAKEADEKLVEDNPSHVCILNGRIAERCMFSQKMEALETSFYAQDKGSAKKLCAQVSEAHGNEVDGASQLMLSSIDKGRRDVLDSELPGIDFDETALPTPSNATSFVMKDNAIPFLVSSPQLTGCLHDEHPSQVFTHIDKTSVGSLRGIMEESAFPSPAGSMAASPSEASTAATYDESTEDTVSMSDKTLESEPLLIASNDSFDGKAIPFRATRLDARSRWRQLKHTVTLVNHMTSNLRAASQDLLENTSDILQHQPNLKEDAGGVGAAAFEGAKTMAQSRLKGRKGMEGLLVRQDKGFITFIQDFYVACLKMPISHFLVGVFLAPVALGLLFTPFYLLDLGGLTFNGVVPEDAATSPLASAKQRCLAVLNVFLYALSLSTTFGGSPVAALSPFCLLVANVNTLLAEFLFVFLSGAVFARMSQPSNPIRCSKKAIIKDDDIVPVLGDEVPEKFKIFAVRLVLTGPSPCELVDAKICLTFRIFIELLSGALFCSTQDLELVRPEVSYLRYGLMVRHIIDRKSPVYGHTLETLLEGDASFSLTVMGMERASMQPIFHLEDYFVSDGDVLWNGDYADFIHINEKGQRVLDHSKIDGLKPKETAAQVSANVTRIRQPSQPQVKVREQSLHNNTLSGDTTTEVEIGKGLLKDWWRGGIQKRKLWKSKSTSFTRADW